jgi:hypothetical protein
VELLFAVFGSGEVLVTVPVFVTDPPPLTTVVVICTALV